MDEDINEGAEVAHRAARQWLDENELVPLALIALEVDEPVELVADRLGDAVRLDDVGMRTIPAAVAREFLAGRAEQAARMEDQARRLQESLESLPVPAGLPAQEGLTPLESLMSADPAYSTPYDEFGGRERPNFLAEELEAGARRLAAAQAEAASKKAARETDR
jgi:hypothetical protein